MTLCPLKRAYALDHFRTELDIRLRATRCPVKHDTRQTVTGRFGQTDIAGNDDVEELVTKMLFQLIRYLLLQRNARIEHDAQQSDYLQVTLEIRVDLLDRVDEVGQAFQREILALHRDNHAVGGAQTVQRE